MKSHELTNGNTRQARGAILSMVFFAGLVSFATPVRACITINGTLTISGTLTASCVKVRSGGKINIASGGILILTGNHGSTSRIDGDIFLQASSAVIEIKDNDHTFSGSGEIIGQANGAEIREKFGQTRQLTLDTDLTVRGALKFKLDLVNNGLVWADDATTAGSRDTLELFSGTFTGSGEWRVQRFRGVNTAILKFAAGITATGLTGDFTVRANTVLDIDDSVTTTGDLTFDGGKIEVAPSKAFTAG